MAKTRRNRPRSSPATVESVEPRLFLSATVHAAVQRAKVAKHPTVTHAASKVTFRPVALAVYAGAGTAPIAVPTATANASTKKTKAKKGKVTVSAAPAGLPGGTSPTGKTPDQVRAAYGLGTSGTALSYPVTFGTTAGDGTGQTIAIIDAYDDPNAIADLHGFSAYFGLPDAPSFQVLDEYGGTNLPSTDPAGANAAGGTWEEEESLDIEWAHAMAPRAKLILYEAASANGDDLYQAALTAAANPAVSVVSMSFGSSEYAAEASNDFVFTTPASRAGGVTFLASTGDGGAGVEAPSSSPNVVAVGGTSLYQYTGGAYYSESGWSGSGGGVSTYETQPAFQAGTVTNAHRSVPDVSAVADPYTGVPIYDSFDFGNSTPWLGGGYVEGGTSLACPLWAGFVALADQGRATEGLPGLDSQSGTLTRLYQLPTTDFHDVTTGSNGAYSATAGYDLVTGLGSPVGNTLVGDLAGTASVTGRVFVDANGNGVYDGGDAGLSAKSVFLDLNNDGVRDNGEPTGLTSSTGVYAFADVPAGGTVRLAVPNPAGYQAVPTATSATIAYGATSTTNFAFFPVAYAGSHYTLQTDATGTVDQVLLNGTLVDSIARSLLTSGLTFTLTGTGGSLTVDASHGSPLSTGGVTVVGSAGQGDTLNVVGTTGDDAVAVTSAAVTFGGVAITYTHLAGLTLNPGAGHDSLTVTSGSLTVAAPPAGTGPLPRTFAALSVGSGASLSFATAANHADRQVVVASTLSLAGSLDLGGNDLVVHNAAVAAVTALVASGFADGAWTGPGLASAAAATDVGHQTALGVAVPMTASFDGLPVVSTDVLVKYTRYGDANLDGAVTAADFTRTDAGFIFASTGWANGDFNYDGVVDGSDYTLADNAFNSASGAM